MEGLKEISMSICRLNPSAPPPSTRVDKIMICMLACLHALDKAQATCALLKTILFCVYPSFPSQKAVNTSLLL